MESTLLILPPSLLPKRRWFQKSKNDVPPGSCRWCSPKRNIWKKLMELDAGLSVADWLTLDRGAYEDVRDGLRYLYGRRSRSAESFLYGLFSIRKLPGKGINSRFTNIAYLDDIDRRTTGLSHIAES
ncbi:hypothetical protein BCR42DRAFT_395220 [Absidia repens]|uniref:Uncharacterized protein n=1 Tax=Absidia repens TaxID=90262 RepID=A0A1X2I8G0_9FUNG|nr:hypothetical protein BCR42DRAFT_395220 [Absidia repens]